VKTKAADKPEPAGARPEPQPGHPPESVTMPAPSLSLPLKLKRILVPIDFSEGALGALDYALALAEQFQARLILLHVVEPAVYPEDYLINAPVLGDPHLVDSSRERLAELERERIGSRVPVETLVRIGRAHSEIPDTAKALGVDLIVIATHGYTGLKHVLLGSTTERVVRHAPCPVLTVRQSGPA
jgi:universal stress protein A